MHICPGCGAQYAVWLSRCGRCRTGPLMDQEAIMAKITRHGGVSDATRIADDDEAAAAGLTVAGEPIPDRFRTAQPVDQPVSDDGPETAGDRPEDESGDESAGSGDDGDVLDDEAEEPAVELPATNALKSVWAEALAGLGVSREWIDADGRTKDDLIENGRGLADGTLRIEDGAPVPNA